MSDVAEKEYEDLKKSILTFLAEKNGHCKFDELDAWGRERGLPRLTLRIALNDLIDTDEIAGSPSLIEVDDFAPWVRIPAEFSLKTETKVVPPEKAIPEVPKADAKVIVQYDETEPNLRRAIEYLNDFPSVGIMRFNLDLQSLQIRDTDQVLKRLSEEGFVEVSPLGVVNATPRLPRMTRSVTLSDLISSKG